MKFEVNRAVMLDAVKCVATVTPTNAAMKELNNILLESNGDTGEIYMTATNYQVSIQQKVIASVEKSGTMLVPPRLLVDMMAKFAGDYISLSEENTGVLKLKGGTCTTHINCLSPKNYPKPIMPFPEQSVIMSGISSLAKRTTFLVSTNEGKPALQCVQVRLKNNAVHAAASDGIGRMMLVRDISEPTNEKEFLLPGRSFQLLASISDDSDIFEVSDMGNEVVFVRGDMIFTIKKLATGNYIDTNSAVANFKPIYTAVAEAGKLKEALNAISLIASIGDIFEPIHLSFSNGEIVIWCDCDYSQGITTVPANVTKDTPDTGFLYNVSALLKLFQVLIGKVKIQISENGIMLVKTRSEVYLQSPMSPNVKKVKPEKEKEETRAEGAEDMKNKAA